MDTKADNTTPRRDSTAGSRGGGGGSTVAEDMLKSAGSSQNMKKEFERFSHPSYYEINPASRGSSPAREQHPPEPLSASDRMIVTLLNFIYHSQGLNPGPYTEQYFKATRTPPITKQSLSELDIQSIINNSKLRHDVNFDRELHFRPNLDGAKGQVKREAQRGYWVAITAELQLYSCIVSGHAPKGEEKTLFKACQRRIPQLFKTIKDILKNLVPERDQPAVEEHLDITMVMQEIGKGVCDFISIAMWLAQLLKRHCAPMRDGMVDRMVEKIQQGQAASISDGLCELFGVLEAMKLDVANHQIRHLRALLIEDTINFEVKYHVSRIKKQRYNVHSARQWYLNGKAALNRIPLTTSWPNRDVEGFVTALVRSLLPTCTTRLPDTFNLDVDRLRALRVEIEELIRENICCEVFEELVMSRGRVATAEAKKSLRTGLQVVASGYHWSIGTISIELARYVLQESRSNAQIDANLLEQVEQKLQHALRDSAVRDRHANELMKEFSKELLSYIENYLTSSPWDIFNALVAPSPTPNTPSIPLPSPRTTDRRKDILQRITHIAVLHWRIWENIVYNCEGLDEAPPGPPPGGYNGEVSRAPSPGVVIQTTVPPLLATTTQPTDDAPRSIPDRES